uniref:Puromycin-sensitive aminopeptidase n=1 Tax=Aegilops tauschii TaxID=37682 RepID=N1R252_AEGTA
MAPSRAGAGAVLPVVVALLLGVAATTGGARKMASHGEVSPEAQEYSSARKDWFDETQKGMENQEKSMKGGRLDEGMMGIKLGANLKASPGAPAAGGSADQFRGKARLPSFAAPRRYELFLRPGRGAGTVAGSVAISVAVSAPTRFLVLNALDLSVNRTSIRFQVKGMRRKMKFLETSPCPHRPSPARLSQALEPTEVVFFKDDGVLVLGFAKQLPLGEGLLKMDFNGTLNDQMRGFYRSKYQYKGKERNMAVTQFESVDARRCFPCWDEPAFKVSHLAVDSFFPQWNIWTQFLDSTTTALRLDSLEASHPIEVEIHHASEVDQIFDAISYDKGASVIRMLQSYLGAERFQKAMASYMKKYAFSNAKTEDLWAVLEKETGEPVKDLMTTWTKQKGYPVINAKIKGDDIEIEQSSERMFISNKSRQAIQNIIITFVLSNAQFLLDGSSGSGMWIVPITSGCGAYDTQKKFLLKLKRDKMVIGSQCGDRKKGGNFWTKLNINGTGFYRVKYDDELAAALQNALETKKLSLMDKIGKRNMYYNISIAGTVDDLYALSIARQQTFASLLRLLYGYRGEADYSVLSHINTVTTSIAKVSADATPALAGDIKQLLIKILLSPAEKLGWDPKKGESHLDVMLRPLLLTALVQLGHGKTINEGVRRFNIFTRDRGTSLLPPDTRKAAYLAVMQNVSSSNRSGYDALRKIYKESAEGEERLQVLGILSSCRDKGIVLESLNLIFTNEVRNQDAYILLRGIQPEAREISWNWLKENWERISRTFSGSLAANFVKNIVPLVHLITVLLPYFRDHIPQFCRYYFHEAIANVDFLVSCQFTSNEKAAEISKFFATRTKPGFERTLKQSLETVRISARWAEGIRSEPGLSQTVRELLAKP